MSGYRKGRKKFRRHFVNCNSSFQGRDVFKRSQKDVVLWLVSPLSVSSSMVNLFSAFDKYLSEKTGGI